MRLERSEEKNPQNYNLPDEFGKFVLANLFVDDYAPNKAIRKKVFDGNAEIEIASDTIRIHWKGDLVAEAQLNGQVETSPDVWQGQLFSFADANIKKIDWRTDVPNWQDGATYNARDIVLHNEVNYEARVNHVTSLPVEQEPGVGSNWQFWWVELDPIDKPFYRAFEIKDIPALGIVDAVFGLDVHWAFKDTKMAFYLDPPGFSARIRWQCRVKDSAVAWTDNTDPENPIHHKGLSFSVSDYKGDWNHGSDVDPETGWTQHWWTFEPTGKQIDAADARTPKERYEQGVGLVVDPYLSVDEQATMIDVYCDGYIARFYKALNIRNPIRNVADTADLGWFTNAFSDSSNDDYYEHNDDGRVLTIIENTPSRVILRLRGTYALADNTPLSNFVHETFYHLYPDKIFMHQIFTVDTSAITLASIDKNATPLLSVSGTNEVSFYEDSESETEGTGDRDGAVYILVTSDECNFQMINLYKSHSGTAVFNQRIQDAGTLIFRIHNGTLAVGTHELLSLIIIDSAEREGSAKKYNETKRLLMGKDGKDTTWPDPDKGSWAVDRVLPANIGEDGFGSDGTWMLDPDVSNEYKVTLDRARIRPAFILDQMAYQYGTIASPTDILLCHLKCDEQAASPNLVDETGNGDATWLNRSDQTDRDTNTSGDSVQVFGRGRNLDDQDGLGFIEPNKTVHSGGFVTKGALMCQIYPQFDYDTVADQFIFTCYIDPSNKLQLAYNAGGDDLRFRVVMENVADDIDSAAFTDNYSLQRPMTMLCFWDFDNDLIGWALDGQVIGTLVKTETPSSETVAEFPFGTSTGFSNPADMLVNDFKTFSDCVLPYGAYHIGNGAGLLADIDNPHADLCFFYDCQASGAGAAKGGTDLATDYTVTLSGASITSGAALVGTNGLDTTGVDGYVSVPVSSRDIIDGSKGGLGIWANLQTLHSVNYRYIFQYFGDSSNEISLMTDSSDQFRFRYESGGVASIIYYSIPNISVWCWIVMTWDDLDSTHLYVNGMEVGTPQSISNSFTGNGGTIYLGYTGAASQDMFVGRMFISKEVGTPEIWTAFGKPLHCMRTFKNGTEVQYGGADNYQLIWTPSGEQLITTEDELVGP